MYFFLNPITRYFEMAVFFSDPQLQRLWEEKKISSVNFAFTRMWTEYIANESNERERLVFVRLTKLRRSARAKYERETAHRYSTHRIFNIVLWCSREFRFNAQLRKWSYYENLVVPFYDDGFMGQRYSRINVFFFLLYHKSMIYFHLYHEIFNYFIF